MKDISDTGHLVAFANRDDRHHDWVVSMVEIPATELSPLARSAGAERRQKVAHGVSRGTRVKGVASPGGA